MKIRATLILDKLDQDYGGMPSLIAAVDNYTEDNWGKVPDWYTQAVKDNTVATDIIREIFIEIPDDAVLQLFATPTIQGEVK